MIRSTTSSWAPAATRWVSAASTSSWCRITQASSSSDVWAPPARTSAAGRGTRRRERRSGRGRLAIAAGEQPDGLQQAVAVAVVDYQATVDQPGERAPGNGDTGSPRDALDRRKVERCRERRDLQQEKTLIVTEHGPRVLEHAQQAGLAAPTSTLQQLESLVQSIDQLREMNVMELRGGELEAEREPVEVSARSHDERQIVAPDYIPNALGGCGEQRHGGSIEILVDGQRRRPANAPPATLPPRQPQHPRPRRACRRPPQRRRPPWRRRSRRDRRRLGAPVRRDEPGRATSPQHLAPTTASTPPGR